MLQTIATRPVGVAELSPPRTCVLGYLAYLELVLAVLLAELGQVGVPAARVARQVRAGESRQAHLTPQISSICRTNWGRGTEQAAHSNAFSRMGARPLAHSTLLLGLATGGEARRARNERIGLLRSVDY